ncbi:hypothetical protein TSAR_005575 [Trichomalopsis sarcophagae]|uniref:Uncharacterized protein n=1 Tax=Trichomalopsis sarcophagae TaxID=543379 RepID=A0A232F8Y7_9HYME|nr:hypothetical protein TSAR_005575 [Trichomalopsis sarcophagae]
MCEVTVSDVVRQFGALKTQYVDKMDENKALRETVELLKNRLQKKEDYRLRLIGIVKLHSDKHRERERCLQNRIDQLETHIAEQMRSIDEYSKRIVVLETTLAEQSEEVESYLNTINKLNKEVASLKDELTHANNNNSIINVSNQSIKKNSAASALNLSHPSFSIDSKEPLKKRRMSKAQIKKKARRWSNLNITISGSNVKKDIDINSSNSSNSESDLSSSREKRRKLYHADEDATIDLSNDKD